MQLAETDSRVTFSLRELEHMEVRFLNLYFA